MNSGKKEPIITVVIRVYNSEVYIEKAIQSALNQTLSKDLFEILIVDDGSEDRSKQILMDYQRKYENLIRLIFKKHEGSIKALNIGIMSSLGNYIIILDSDDEFEKNILKEMYNVLNHYDVNFVYSDYYEKKNDSQERIYFKVGDNLLFTLAAGIMFRKKDLLKFGLYDETLILPEYDMIMKFKKNSLKGFYINKALFTYNRRPGSITSDKNLVKEAKRQLKQKWGKNIQIREY